MAVPVSFWSRFGAERDAWQGRNALTLPESSVHSRGSRSLVFF